MDQPRKASSPARSGEIIFFKKTCLMEQNDSSLVSQSNEKVCEMLKIDIETAPLSQLAVLYNDCAKKIGEKEVAKFPNRAVGERRTREVLRRATTDCRSDGTKRARKDNTNKTGGE